MSFRLRLTLSVAGAIAVTVAAASIAVWVVAKHELLTQFDRTMIQQATEGHGPSPFDPNTIVTFTHPDGTISGHLPVSNRAMQVATGKRTGAYLTDANVKDATGKVFHLREYISPTSDGGEFTGAVIVAQPLQ